PESHPPPLHDALPISTATGATPARSRRTTPSRSRPASWVTPSSTTPSRPTSGTWAFRRRRPHRERDHPQRVQHEHAEPPLLGALDRKSTRLNSSHVKI